MANFLSDFFENRGWLGLVQKNATTGILSVAGTTLVSQSVDTVTDLLALSTTTYDKQRVMVNNPGNNAGYGYGTVAGIPAPAYCYNGAWHWENGKLVFGIYAEALQLTCPAATFTSPAVSNNGGLVKLTSAGAHGLTAANAITAQSKVRILSGTNWVLDDYDVTAITLDTTGVDFTINYTYDAGLGVPTLALIDASVEREIVRIKTPKTLTTRARYELVGSFRTVVAAATATIVKAYLVADGADYTTASSPIGQYTFTAAANIANFNAGVVQLNSRTKQRTQFAIAAASGSGTNATDSVALAVDMNFPTDLILTALIQTADRPLRIDSVMARGYDA